MIYDAKSSMKYFFHQCIRGCQMYYDRSCHIKIIAELKKLTISCIRIQKTSTCKSCKREVRSNKRENKKMCFCAQKDH